MSWIRFEQGGTGGRIVSLSEFLQDNPDLDRVEVKKSLEETGSYGGGGGASPAWSIRSVCPFCEVRPANLGFLCDRCARLLCERAGRADFLNRCEW